MLKFLAAITLIVLTLSINIHADDEDSTFCNILETVNITDGFEINGTIIYDGITYQPEHFKTFDYYLLDDEKIPVTNHTRGCICYYKPCVRLCCAPNSIYNYTESECVTTSDIQTDLNVTILLNNIESIENLYGSDYAILHGRTCAENLSHSQKQSEWRLKQVENEIKLELTADTLLDHNHFCLAGESSNIRAVLCSLAAEFIPESDNDFSFGTFMAACVLLGLSFVYIYYEELRESTYGRCFTAYVITLSVVYVALFIGILFESPRAIASSDSSFFYIVLIGILSSLVWIILMNFEYWQNQKTGTQSSSLLRILGFASISILVPVTAVILPVFLYRNVSESYTIVAITSLVILSVLYVLPVIFLILTAYIIKHKQHKTAPADETARGAAIQMMETVAAAAIPQKEHENLKKYQEPNMFLVNILVVVSSVIFISLLIGQVIYYEGSALTLRILTNLVSVIHAAFIFYVLIWRTKAKELIFTEE